MIRELVLRRFKRFEEEHFDLSGHVILAGPNNCGKTTVLQAISAWALAFRHWRGYAEQRSAAEKKPAKEFVYKPRGGYEWAPIARQAFSAVPLRAFDLLWNERQYDGVLEIEAVLANGQKVGFEYRADSSEQIHIRPKKEVSSDFLLGDLPSVVYVASISGLSIEEPVYQPDYIATLLGRQRPGDVIRNLLLLASQGVAWSKLTASVQRLFGVELQVPQTPGGQIICEYKQRPDGPDFDLLSAGSGLQQVVLLLACVLTRQASLVLVDEPDAHLHVFLQETIFAELRKAAAESGSQLVIATHSEVIFNSAAPEQICIMVGKPHRMESADELKKLRQAVAVLQQSDLVAANMAPGVLYLEGHTDLNLLREWARILRHPVADYLNRTPFWQPIVWDRGDDAKGVRAQDHFNALQLVKPGISAVWLLDADGKKKVQPSEAPESGRLNRQCWRRYETESYLVHPAALARFIDQQAGEGGEKAVLEFLGEAFDRFAGKGLGAQIAAGFIADPAHPAQIVENFLQSTKARTVLLGGVLQQGGLHGMEYTEFDQIAAAMLPEEIHPEVIEKLDFIQQAFGL